MAEARAVPAPVWVGELGIDHKAGKAGAYMDTSLKALDEAGAGWAWWQWRQDGGWGIRNDDGHQLNMVALRQLAKPYLQAAPSGVSTAASDPGDALTVQVDARHGDQAIQVGWPALISGEARVTGTCLRDWNSAGPVLWLHVLPRSSCTIQVTTARP